MILANGTRTAPALTFEGIWDFIGGERTSLSGQTLDADDDLRSRAEGGVTVTAPGVVSFTATGNHDGIGYAGFQAYGGSAALNVPF